MAKQHFDEIDICKGIAILTVLWHHSFIKFPIYMLDIPWCQHTMSINTTFFMVVFFMISGYLFSFSRPRSFIENLKNKSQRLMIPYFAYAVVNFVMKIIAPQLVNRPVKGSSYLLDLFFYGGEFWFVYVLFLIFVIWPCLLPKMNRIGIIIAIISLEIVRHFIPGDFNHALFLYPRVLYYSVWFLIGYVLKKIDRKWLQNNQLFILSAILFVVFNCVFVRTIKIPFIWSNVLSIIGCWFVWSLSFQFLKMKYVSKALTFVGKYSLAYYWLNGFVLVVARTVVVRMLHIESTPLIVLSIFALCVMAETLAIMIIRRIPYLRSAIGI